MGIFKINGTNILDLADIRSSSSATTRKSVAFSSGKLNVTGLADSDKTLSNAPATSYPGWFFTNIVGNKLKVNGVVDTVSKKGCRPIFIEWSAKSNGSAQNQNTSTNTTITLTYNSSSDAITVNSPYTSADSYVSSSLLNGSVYNHISVIMFSILGGGGGGGGSGVGKGGGGGGGGGSVVGLIDFKTLPGNKLTIELGHAGNGGHSTGSTGVAGAGGGRTVVKDGNGTELCIAYGGGGGANGGAGGGAGGGGGTDVYVDTSYFRLLTRSNGASGGSAGGGAGNKGGDTADITYTTPDGTYTQKKKTGGNNGASGKNRGGGGGAGGTGLPWSEYYNSGGIGGNDSNSAQFSARLGGGGGGAGGTAIFNGAAGADGAGGMFRVYYGSDYS